MKKVLILITLPFLASCDLADRMEGQSPGKDYIQRLSALEAGMAAIRATPAVAPIASVPQPIQQTVAPTVEPVTVPVAVTPKPVCHEVFRINRCGPNGEVLEW